MITPLPKMPHPTTAIEPNSDENRPWFVVQSWTKLPPHIREAIVTLVDSALRGPVGGAQ